ncbi:MAG: glutamate-5-semialdehyde dehydrogenase [Syntrophorhabdaceae bacterium]|nr:glutamate-5-semialdehyde dehydrogenase [Syntrophorhabdaceae bacterium]MDD4195637.1 glutamate-5-semialdehyde dehydrogenase [Syntrophorhabdaceae bacterium]
MKAEKLAQSAKAASDILAHASTDEKNRVLLRLAEKLAESQDYLYEENAKDISAAQKEGLAKSLIDRLRMDDKIVREMQGSLEDVAALPDPVGEIIKTWKRPNDLLVGRMRIPIGVILIIYESRPNVTIEAFSLCLKSGNCVILKGGSEAYHSNKALHKLIVETLEGSNIPADAVQFVETADREFIYSLLEREEEIDLVIPRGGEALIRSIVERSRIPVLKHYKGVCHIYVDEEADEQMALDVSVNAKAQKPATCNALETLLVHEKIAGSFLPKIHEELKRQGVVVKGCDKTAAILKGIEKATDADWYMEYLDLTLSIKVVNDMTVAIDHIRKYGSSHTEAIITTNYDRAWKFMREINSSLVLVNASTRLNDGFQLGLGAEMGISTTRLHAFGPMGLEELTVTKFIGFGNGQLRT